MKEFFFSIHLIPASHVLDIYECLGFGGEEDDVLLNHCLLLVRYYIYCCKFKNVSPCIGEYVQRLKFSFEIEKQVSMVTGSENKFQQRWCKILQALQEVASYTTLISSVCLIQSQFLLQYFFAGFLPFFYLALRLLFLKFVLPPFFFF